jgi:L-histidine N-alpha-methyltransferase
MSDRLRKGAKPVNGAEKVRSRRVPDRIGFVAVDDGTGFWHDDQDLVTCLSEPVPRIPPVYGYDARGSALFEEITRLPTYYLTRVEWKLLRRAADDIATQLGAGALAELGSGSAKKTAVLLAACVKCRPTTYLPVDVSAEMLRHSAVTLSAELPSLNIVALHGRYEAGLRWLSDQPRETPLIVSFLGSNAGNATPDERSALFSAIAEVLRSGDGLLLSADLIKTAAVHEKCYNDPPGFRAFAEFRLNHLTHLNNLFGADFDPGLFAPRAYYNTATNTVEGHLYANSPIIASLPDLGLVLHLPVGETINVGFSAKFDTRELARELQGHGLNIEQQWLDSAWHYGIFLARKH